MGGVLNPFNTGKKWFEIKPLQKFIGCDDTNYEIQFTPAQDYNSRERMEFPDFSLIFPDYD